MPYNFEKLNVWHESRTLLKNIYVIVDNFPAKEQFALTSQIKRAAISIPLNIAEGSGKSSKKDFIRFLRISVGSIYELVTAFYIAKDLKYIKEAEFTNFYNDSHKICAMINALINKLK